MKTIILPIGALSALAMLSACATIDRGTSEPFEVQTNPSGAKVTTSLGDSCAPTPCVIPNVSREADFTVTVKKRGYRTRSYRVMHARSEGANGHLIPNVVMTGGIGIVIDANNGSTQELVPNPLVVTLERENILLHPAQKTNQQIIDDALAGAGRD